MDCRTYSDYQDPWINDYYQITGVSPPGGRLKYAISQWEAGTTEPVALRESSGVIAVSDAYGCMLANNYPWFLASRVKLLPFGAAAMDIERLGSYVPAKPIIDFSDGLFHQVYVGRCGPDMSVALKILFRAFKCYSETFPERAAKMRFNFIGTDYAPPPFGRDWALPVAKDEGVLDFVREHRYRVPYFDSLYYMKNADALVAVGSNDPTYSASKFFSYILVNRPLLMIFHGQSPVLRFARNMSAGFTYGFSGPDDISKISEIVYRQWYVEEKYRFVQPFDASSFAPFSAERMVKGLVHVFDDALKENAREAASS